MAMRHFPFTGPRPWLWTAGLLVLIVGWDISGLDVPLAAWMGGSEGFPLRNNPWMADWLHVGGRNVTIFLGFALIGGIAWPWGPLRRLSRAERIWLVLTIAACASLVGVIKTYSETSCPWDLQTFGGKARYVSHWRWGVSDGGGGRCFPAGHASSVFAYIGAVFLIAARRRSPLNLAGDKLLWRWMVIVLVLGFAFGLLQQWRGAHYMSHTFWTAWLCWALSFASWQAIGVRYVRASSDLSQK